MTQEQNNLLILILERQDYLIDKLDKVEKQTDKIPGIERRKKSGFKAFIDGPHFELARKVYP